MRPLYETEEDRAKEQSVLEYISETYSCGYQSTPHLSCVDAFLTGSDGELLAAIEIKTRKNIKDKYPTYMLSARKWRSGLELANQYKIPLILAVKFTDGLYYTQLTENVAFGVGGRYDRNDSMDIEQCVYIPMEKFKPL